MTGYFIVLKLLFTINVVVGGTSRISYINADSPSHSSVVKVHNCDDYKYNFNTPIGFMCNLRKFRTPKNDPQKIDPYFGDSVSQHSKAHNSWRDLSKLGFKEQELLWRKRQKPSKSKSIAYPITILGLPLLWTLVLSMLVKDHLEETKIGKRGSMSPMAMPMSNEKKWSNKMTDMKMTPEEENSKEKEQEDIDEAIDTIGFTKEIIKIATQSFNLASNTVELFNILRGSDNEGGGGGGSVITSTSKRGHFHLNAHGEHDWHTHRDGSDVPETDTYSNIKLAAKFLQLSSSIIFVIVQFLGF